MKKLKSLILVAAILIAGLFTTRWINANNEQDYVVLFNHSAGQVLAAADWSAAVESLGGQVVTRMQTLPVMKVRLSLDEVRLLQESPLVRSVEPNILFHADAQTLGWGNVKTNVQTAWDNGLTGAGVKIAVVDTGIAAHPDLNIAGGVDLVDDGVDNYQDVYGHGTHVAGIAAALNNSIGVVGAAPDASLYAVKVLRDDGSGTLSEVLAGVDWSIANGMQVINMSLGTNTYSTALEDSLQTAYDNGILCVAAAGNNGAGTDNVSYPGRFSSVLCVSATTSSDVIADFSSRGPAVDLAAPGDGIYSTYTAQSYTTMKGTSMATPMVSGIMALYRQAYPQATAAELYQMVEAGAVDLGTAGLDSLYGYGLVQAPQGLSSQAEILTYALPGQVGASTIDSASGTIQAVMPSGSSLTSLKATFTTSSKIQSIKVGSVAQISGTTSNNFTSPVTYTVKAEDGTVKNWTVTVLTEQLTQKTDLADGTYKLGSVYSGKSLGIYPVSYGNGGEAAQYPASAVSNQALVISGNGDGSYTLRFLHSKKVLDEAVAEGKVLQWTSHGGDNQRWIVYQDGSGKLYLKNKKTGHYLSMDALTDNAKPALNAAPVLGDSRYQFTLTSVGTLPSTPYVAEIEDGRYAIRSKKSGLYLDIYGASSDPGANLIIWPGHFAANQIFQVSNTATGTLLSPTHSGLMLDVYGASSAIGNQIIQWPYHGADNQIWLIGRNAGDGSYTVTSKMSGLVLDVYGGYGDPGTRVIQWTSHGGDNQRWFFEAK